MQVSQRKTPVQDRSVATVECVLEAAAHILAETGLAGLNTNAVARRAGVSIGSLYQYFPAKEAIIAALILRSHEHIAAGLRRLLVDTSGLPFLPAIAALIDMLLKTQSGTPQVSQILETEEERLPRTPELAALESEISRLNLDFFGRFVDPRRCSPGQLQTAGDDTIGIVRALLDGAVKSRALEAPDLRDRVSRTIAGYFAPLLRHDGDVA